MTLSPGARLPVTGAGAASGPGVIGSGTSKWDQALEAVDSSRGSALKGLSATARRTLHQKVNGTGTPSGGGGGGGGQSLEKPGEPLDGWNDSDENDLLLLPSAQQLLELLEALALRSSPILRSSREQSALTLTLTLTRY